MQSQAFFYVDMQGKGKGPLPLHSIPKTNVNNKTKSNNKTKNKIKVVYTEVLTHPLKPGEKSASSKLWRESVLGRRARIAEQSFYSGALGPYGCTEFNPR